MRSHSVLAPLANTVLTTAALILLNPLKADLGSLK